MAELAYRNKESCTSHNAARLIRGGKAYFDLLEDLIGKATETIHLQVYIFTNDETGEKIAAALKKAAARKVAVYLMADGYASQSLPDTFISDIERAGVLFRFFDPVLKSRHFYFGRRMHHKVLVVDGRHALVAGINISDRYNDMPGQPAWLDFGLYAEGEIASKLYIRCIQIWRGFSYKSGRRLSTEIKKVRNTFGGATEVCMKLNDWVYRRNEISKTYLSLLYNAEEEAFIMSSYFLPGKMIRRQLAKAAARGVKIKIITAGNSDVAISKYAERWLYDWLLRKGADIYEYKKNVLHAKIAVFDRRVVTVGSYNINNISAHASIELNLNVYHPGIAQEAATIINEIIQNDCEHVTSESHLKSKNMFSQFVRWFSYQCIRLIIFLFTFYFRQER